MKWLKTVKAEIKLNEQTMKITHIGKEIKMKITYEKKLYPVTYLIEGIIEKPITQIEELTE